MTYIIALIAAALAYAVYDAALIARHFWVQHKDGLGE
jgi:hypothetical protein